jgi:hypothetical protein
LLQEGEQVGVDVVITSSSSTSLHISIHSIQKLGVGWKISASNNKEIQSAAAHKRAPTPPTLMKRFADVVSAESETTRVPDSTTCSNTGSELEIFYSDDSSTEEEEIVKWVEVVAEEKDVREQASHKVSG